ncbi:hypothetical protein ADIMK_0028 [Marinobacterium lacunae]|uniref:Uncharacterized protein n=1 Tax=Marinobacterium lacunae TaxID=1232683 RepID=A0A081G4L1_9GAMM|nr:hypothetical protein [Marinobacterium lacunae]KEA65716.1 hypothetical protein ADIMK_0028 [Marinobacterium lacunae]
MSENEQWNGRNRRSGQDRRQQPDRREDIRFEPGKKDRRQNRGRRVEDRDMWEEAMKED